MRERRKEARESQGKSREKRRRGKVKEWSLKEGRGWYRYMAILTSDASIEICNLKVQYINTSKLLLRRIPDATF